MKVYLAPFFALSALVLTGCGNNSNNSSSGVSDQAVVQSHSWCSYAGDQRGHPVIMRYSFGPTQMITEKIDVYSNVHMKIHTASAGVSWMMGVNGAGGLVVGINLNRHDLNESVWEQESQGFEMFHPVRPSFEISVDQDSAFGNVALTQEVIAYPCEEIDSHLAADKSNIP